MRKKNNRQTRLALKKAHQSMNKGNRTEARKLILSALEIDPCQESLWLMMAELASDKAKMGYLKKALEINPDSQPARQAIHDFITSRRQLLQNETDRNETVKESTHTTDHSKITSDIEKNNHIDIDPSWSNYVSFILKFAGFSIILVLFCIAFFIWTSFSNDRTALANAPVMQRPANVLLKPTLTPTLELIIPNTSTFVPTDTNTPTLTYSVTASPTYAPTQTAPDIIVLDESINKPVNQETEKEPETPQIKNVLLLTETAKEIEESTSAFTLPSGIAPDEKWIDINLNSQQLSAFIGNENIRSFSVSTGTSYTPTPSGLFHIYVKYPAADMYGPGYYLPGVPSVMYFNKDYGIHGAYWHMNFGTPMSHGCVNMKLEDAAWLFDWSSVGTTVNIHY